MAQQAVKSATERSSFVENKLREGVYNTSGLTAVALINQISLSHQLQLTLCSAGTGAWLNAMCISQMFQWGNTLDSLRFSGDHLSDKVRGSLGAGHFKSFLLCDQSNSSPGMGKHSVIRIHQHSRFMRSLESQLMPCKGFLYLSSPLMSECLGQCDEKPLSKKIKPTANGYL